MFTGSIARLPFGYDTRIGETGLASSGVQRQRNAGTVVAESDVLAEMVCDNDPLQAGLIVPQRGMAQATAGQPATLQYDAFPYQRYGVRYATAR